VPKLRMKLSTGLPALDHVFRGMMPGDNVVWQVDSVKDYLPFVKPFAAYAVANRQKLVYFRFAEHEPLLTEEEGADIYVLQPGKGFEPFLSEVHSVIESVGRGNLYLFDGLSELAADWCSDRMLGNFFMLTCPLLYDRAAVAYFAILRNFHSFHAITPISNTTQILVDVYQHEERLYIHPLKVQYRHSPTMYMLHVWEGDGFAPVTQSCVITEMMEGIPWSHREAASYLRGYWSKTFADAEQVQLRLDQGQDCREEADRYFHKLTRMLISHDEPVLRLAERYFTLRDLLAIRRRMIGTGLIGGKSVGMLLARAILTQRDAAWSGVLEGHDSFFVGADVFYTYLVQNGSWWMMQKVKAGQSPEGETETARRRLLAGEFPEYIVEQFADMLGYFGQSPIIVRSSSLLEDNFGNAFAGKYESVFCANQGGPHKRLEDFLFAVRTVYASTMSDEALTYRRARGLLDCDEQMALLIQRVSGARYGNLFYPQAAGVGFSFNPYVWHPSIDPEAGMMRLVFGMGTRAVERADDDYTRVVALNAPERRPEADAGAVREYAQRRVDVLDLEANQMTSLSFEDVLRRSEDVPVDMFVSRDRHAARAGGAAAADAGSGVLTFQKLLTATGFVDDMRGMMRTLQEAYEYPVDTEFTLNFFEGNTYRINLVQCRPLEVRGESHAPEVPKDIPRQDVILESGGPVIGKSTVCDVDWLIYVVPARYGRMEVSDRYAVARLIGEITHVPEVRDGTIMLVGPGRWATTTPALGVPVSFAEMSPAAIVCEVVAMRDDFVPDVSLGTHFFNELVENNMLYLALFPGREGNFLNADFLERQAPSRLTDLLPNGREWGEAVRVIRASDLGERGGIRLHAGTVKQRVVCYRGIKS